MLKAQASLGRTWPAPVERPRTSGRQANLRDRTQVFVKGPKKAKKKAERRCEAMTGDGGRCASSEARGARLRLPPDAPKTRVQAKVVTNQSLPYTV